MTNLDAVAIFSILTIAGSIVVLVLLGLKARHNIFGRTVAEKPVLGDDNGKS